MVVVVAVVVVGGGVGVVIVGVVDGWAGGLWLCTAWFILVLL